MKKITLSLVFVTAVLVAAPHAQTRGASAEDYFAFETLGDPHFRAEGPRSAFVVTPTIRKRTRRGSVISWGRAAGWGEPQPLTDAARSSNAPRWRPDGKAIAFLSARPAPGDDTPRTQVWLLP